MDGCGRVEDYSLRFINVSLEDVEPMKDFFPKEVFSIRRYFKDRSRYVAVVDLKEGLDYRAIERFMREHVQGVDCDVFVSVSTESDNEIVDVPAYVVDFIRKINSRLTFSFTVTD